MSLTLPDWINKYDQEPYQNELTNESVSCYTPTFENSLVKIVSLFKKELSAISTTHSTSLRSGISDWPTYLVVSAQMQCGWPFLYVSSGSQIKEVYIFWFVVFLICAHLGLHFLCVTCIRNSIFIHQLRACWSSDSDPWRPSEPDCELSIGLNNNSGPPESRCICSLLVTTLLVNWFGKTNPCFIRALSIVHK